LNNWEATYFDFDERTILEVARSGAELGVELFVLDDGWFGERNADDRSLGDWWVNRKKLPSGISGLAEQIRALGMRFGLWVEPEMVSPESELYRSRPQWALEIPGRRQALGRRQLVLDLTREEVQRYLIDTLLGILDGAPIDYIKWDMNRYLTHAASPSLPPERRGETAHRYVLGLYRVLDAVTAHAPGVLFEGCSGGGGRFDPGILAYMPQYWTSDNTDAVARLGIQEGTSLVYPPVTMGAHVSAVPNHQTGRTTGIETRGAVAMAGNLGYELDPRALGAADREAVAEQIAFYRRYRGLIQYGGFHRLELGGAGGAGARAWLFTGAESGSGPTGPASGSGPAEALLFWIPGMVEANRPRPRIRIPGLDPDRSYVVRDLYPASAWPSVSAACGAAPQSGAELSRRGLVLPKSTKDFDALVLYLGS
jgi:alpha-galactosidase